MIDITFKEFLVLLNTWNNYAPYRYGPYYIDCESEEEALQQADFYSKGYNYCHITFAVYKKTVYIGVNHIYQNSGKKVSEIYRVHNGFSDLKAFGILSNKLIKNRVF